MRKVFICSPLRGDIEGNIGRAIGYARVAALDGHIPIAPHIYFTQFLREEMEEERALGIQMGIHLLDQCDELWVFGESLSEGMRKEMGHWSFYHTHKPLVFFSAEGQRCS